MTGLMFDAFVFAVLFFGTAFTFLLGGALVELGKARLQLIKARRQLAKALRPPPVDRLLWTGESWEDPREALALESCKRRHPSNRNR